MRSVSSFRLQIGQHVEPGLVRGYYIDLGEKAPTPGWPPPGYPYRGMHRFIALGQWGLAALDREIAGDGEIWLAGAAAAGEHLLVEQLRSGRRRGAWEEPADNPHTYMLRGPWVSAMAQGLCASLLVRLYLATGRDEFAESARLALEPYDVPTEKGGVQARLPDGRVFFEEYPTQRPSCVLNGGIYALWGLYDVGIGLGESTAGHAFDAAVDALAQNLHRWDLGYWSSYDLYRHPLLTNISSTSYHLLHVNQLRVLEQLTARPEFGAMAQRFAEYADNRASSTRALVNKIAFRLVVPRSQSVSKRLPWLPREY